MAFADTKTEGETGGVLGDALTLVAAALYACYTITLKRMMPEGCESDMMLFFAYLGVINVAIFGPVLVVFQLAGAFDVFAISATIFGWALLKGARRRRRSFAHGRAPDRSVAHVRLRARAAAAALCLNRCGLTQAVVQACSTTR